MIRVATAEDFSSIWPIFAAIAEAGDTLAFGPGVTLEQARAYWMGSLGCAYVALRQGAIVGSYYLRPNQPGLGDHVGNAGFIVSPDARGRGIGRAMGEHCLREARAMGYLAMQFNFVVSTNERAVALWKSLGFAVVATVPRSFRHREHGHVATYVMHQFLDDQSSDLT